MSSPFASSWRNSQHRASLPSRLANTSTRMAEGYLPRKNAANCSSGRLQVIVVHKTSHEPNARHRFFDERLMGNTHAKPKVSQITEETAQASARRDRR